MKTIWKYSLVQHGFKDRITLNIPHGAEVLSLQIDQKNNHPSIWVLVDPEATMTKRVFELFGTGHEIHYDMGIDREYVGTYQYQNGKFVGHVFERIN